MDRHDLCHVVVQGSGRREKRFGEVDQREMEVHAGNLRSRHVAGRPGAVRIAAVPCVLPPLDPADLEEPTRRVLVSQRRIEVLEFLAQGKEVAMPLPAGVRRHRHGAAKPCLALPLGLSEIRGVPNFAHAHRAAPGIRIRCFM